MKITQDKIDKLETIVNKLVDKTIEEINPSNWIAGHTPIADMSKEERGDNYWCKKTAAMTLTLTMKSATLVDVLKNRIPAGVKPGEEDDLEKDIQAAEREYEKIMGTPKVESMILDFKRKKRG